MRQLRQAIWELKRIYDAELKAIVCASGLGVFTFEVRSEMAGIVRAIREPNAVENDDGSKNRARGYSTRR